VDAFKPLPTPCLSMNRANLSFPLASIQGRADTLGGSMRYIGWFSAVYWVVQCLILGGSVRHIGCSAGLADIARHVIECCLT